MTNKTNINPTSNEQHCAHKAGKSDHKDLIPRSKANPETVIEDLGYIHLFGSIMVVFKKHRLVGS